MSLNESSSPISVLLVDDHPTLRIGLEAVVKSRSEFQLQGSVSSGKEAVEFCRRKGIPDVVILDVRMPDWDGFETLGQMQRVESKVRVLMLAGLVLKHEVERAREAGAYGYVSKGAEVNVVLDAIRAVSRGMTAFASVSRRESQDAEHGLSAREMEVLRLMARGLSRGDMALALHISMETVKSHVKSILVKMEASDRTEAVARAFEVGLLQA
ncbi:MAG: response regulator transcription factor [Verrucomicrobiaceae bacterium]|nr:response regulator transcription factor [Verrucomicrobiaceae bacterium]